MIITVLENKQLVNKSTENLLHIKKKLNKVLGRRHHDIETGDCTTEDYQLFKKYEDYHHRLVEILNNREHIEDKPRSKHNHDKRSRNEGRMRKRSY